MLKVKVTALLLLLPLFLTGCLYPEQKTAENQVPYKEQIQSVQSAIDQFREDEGGILPIKTKSMETPYYQKYLVDFPKIVPKYMAEPPGNSYESGGVFQYVIIDVETDPKVKIFDVRIAQEIQDLNLRLTAYRQQNGYPPFKERLSNDVFTIDYEKMGLKEVPAVLSPYSQKTLSIVINSDVELFVDYTPDLYDALQKKGNSYKQGEDIRSILTDDSDFVPAYSLPYTIDQTAKKPIFLTK
ncbi:hypothetical protein ELQ35_10040 [Peribacillus cavernae]|uniref:ABC transporter periplasmic binding protein yphF n=1 Tax=Peribacillus cavernae TaxID=1674310 RepID=A0A3S0VNB4_9BACI|nr:hypothetical protein [Peribacillus cavernae]MDQ0218997.1 hypothetical protein [Peribacillus cavernae]RUQ29297.1 hypothetical protein ELQ35_10040 [Peribacillus cavernae]